MTLSARPLRASALMTGLLLLSCGAPSDPPELPTPSAPSSSPSRTPSPTPSPSSSPSQSPSPTDAPALPMGDAHLTPDFLGAGVPTGRLVGYNLGAGTFYAPEGDPLHPEWRTPEAEAAIARLAALEPGDGRPQIIRFSGLQIDGSLGQDGYHYSDYVDPEHTPGPEDNLSSFHTLALMTEARAEPMILVNFGSGTAAEAAGYVRHLTGTDATDPDVAARQHWGFEDPWAVDRFEIGNEVYGFWNTGYISTGAYSYANPKATNGGDPDWIRRPSSDPGDFGLRALAYVEAMVAERPGAQLWIPLTQSAMDGWGGLGVSLPALAPLLAHPAVAELVVHQYKVDDVLAEGETDVNNVEMILGGTAYYRPGFEALRAELGARGLHQGVAVTEFHVAGAFAVGFEHSDTPLLGLGMADLLIEYAYLRIDTALQHTAIGFHDPGDDAPGLFEPWYNPFRADGAGGVIDMPTYQVTDLFARHLRATSVALPAAKNPEGTGFVRDEPFPYDLVHAVAFRGPEDGTIVGMNRRTEGPLTLTLDLPEGWRIAAVTLWAPETLDQDAKRLPTAETSLDSTCEGSRCAITLPPHCVFGIVAAPAGP